MPCYQPLFGWYCLDGEERGKVIFQRQPGIMYVETPLPCGQCLGCRMEQARQWAIRCCQEAEMHDDNCMVTLTYDDANLPDDGGLRPEHPTLWLKKLRRKFPEKKIRYFLAGEYGDKLSRPHYHVLLFGIDFANDIDYNVKDTRPPQSDLQETWTHGYVNVAPLTYETAAYVARYCLKKQKSEMSYCDKSTGVILHREYTRMSRGRGKVTGIGSKWISSFEHDTYKTDSIHMQGSKISRPPRYYDKQHIKFHGDNSLDKIKQKRIEESFKRRQDSTPERLAVREKIQRAKQALTKRGYENG